MNSRLLFLLWLAFALLFAQQGAALHALSHLADSVPAQSQQEKNLPHSPACDKCVVYAQLGSAVGCVHVVHGLQSSHEAIPAPPQPYRHSDHHSHYAARAPPVLL